jgi:hypothetical protein
MEHPAMTPSPEIVERVARAMIESVRQDNDGRWPIFLDEDDNPLFGMVDGMVDFAKLAQAALAALGDVPAWQGIESAPKDGTRVLLWIMPTAIAMPFEWNGERWMGDEYPLNMASPTHWMPLPARPQV